MLPRAFRFAANNAIALLALFLALGGASYAATGAFKASSSPVYKACVGESNVVVLKSGSKPCGKHKRTIAWDQQGPAGATGATGATGPAGATGAAGTAGKNGFSALSTLPSGASESGDFSVFASGHEQNFVTDSYSFPIPLAAPIDGAHFQYLNPANPTTQCPGMGRAAPGFLCIYTVEREDIELLHVFSYDSQAYATGAGRFGFDLEWQTSSEEAFDGGSWTVTAP